MRFGTKHLTFIGLIPYILMFVLISVGIWISLIFDNKLYCVLFSVFGIVLSPFASNAFDWFQRATSSRRVGRHYKNLADAGDAVAMANLGIMYRYGKFVSRDGKSAGWWFRKAAEAGDIGGMMNLAEMLEKGICGLQKDPVEAISWYQRAADLGSRAAQRRLNP